MPAPSGDKLLDISGGFGTGTEKEGLLHGGLLRRLTPGLHATRGHPPIRHIPRWGKCRPRGTDQMERKLQSCPIVAPQALGSQLKEPGPPRGKRAGRGRTGQGASLAKRHQLHPTTDRCKYKDANSAGLS